MSLTAVKVPGRKIKVTPAIIRMSALSLRVSNATLCESSATLFMALLSCSESWASRPWASVAEKFSWLSRWPMRLYI